MENLDINCSKEDGEKQYRNLLDNSQQNKSIKEHLSEIAKSEEVKQETDKSIQLRVSDFAGEKDKHKNVNNERKQIPKKSFSKLAKDRHDSSDVQKRLESFYLRQKELIMKTENRQSVRPNFDPLNRKVEDVEEDDNGHYDHVCINMKYVVVESLDIFQPAHPPPDLLDDSNPDNQQQHINFSNVHVQALSPYIHPPAPPLPDHLDDINPDNQQPHINLNHPDIENNQSNLNVINTLPLHYNNPASLPPDHLD